MNTPVSLHRRFEDKYLVQGSSIGSILSYLRRFGEMDPHSHEGKYQVTSLYLDTRDLRCYHEYMNGKKNRFKIRLRSYDEFKTSSLELKVKENRLSYKSRYQGSVDLENFVLPQMPDLSPLTYQQLKSQKFIPTIFTRYDRYAYSLEDFRITLDTNLSYAKFSPHPLFRHSSSVVVEIKGSNDYPRMIQDLLMSLRLSRTSFSKYAEGVERLGLA